MRVVGVGFLLVTVVFAGGCDKTRGLRNKDAVRAAIEAHLKRNSQIMLNNMTTEVQEVNFQDGTAEAFVKYQSKEAPDIAVRVRYSLKRVADHWEVTSSSSVGGQGMNAHGAEGTPAPAPHPATSGAEATPPPQSSH